MTPETLLAPTAVPRPAGPVGAVFVDAHEHEVFGQIVAGHSVREVVQSLLAAALRLTGAPAGAVQCRAGDGFTGPWLTDGVTAEAAERLNRVLDGYHAGSGVRVLEAGHPVLLSLPGAVRPAGVTRAVSRGDDTRLTLLLLGDDDRPAPTASCSGVLDTLLTVAGVAISNLECRDSLRRHEQWCAALDATARIMLGGVTARSVLESVLEAVAERALEVSDADMCAIATPDDRGSSMVLRVAVGRHRQTLTGLLFPESHSLSGTVARSARQLLVEDAATDARATAVAAEVALGPAAIAPLLLGGQVVGVVFVGNTRGERPLDRGRAVESVTVRDLSSWVHAAAGHASAEDGLHDLAARMKEEARVLQELPKLSQREYELLHLLAEGLTNGEIGARLFLAEKTVRNLVSQLLGRLGLSNRVEAAVLVTRYAERHRR